MQRRFWVVAALVSLAIGCGNERNAHHASKTFPTSTGTTVTMGRPGDHWADTMQFVRVARAQRGNHYGYEVTYEAPGGTTFTLFWSRDQIDLRGTLPNYRLENMPLGDGRLLYPDKLTQESLPDVYQAIQLIEDDYAGDADGAITAAEMFGVVAALGGAAPAPRAPRVPARRRVPPARASVSGGQAVRGTSSQLARHFGTSPERVRLLERVITPEGGVNTSRVVARQLARGGARQHIPTQSILETIGSGTRVADPQGVAGHFMYRVSATINGSQGTLEVLVHEASGQIRHVLFKSGVP